MKEFISDHIDKLLVSYFVTLLIGICFFFAVKGIDGKAMDWATNAFGIFVGLLGGLITGVAIGRASVTNSAQSNTETAGPVSPKV